MLITPAGFRLSGLPSRKRGRKSGWKRERTNRRRPNEGLRLCELMPPLRQGVRSQLADWQPCRQRDELIRLNCSAATSLRTQNSDIHRRSAGSAVLGQKVSRLEYDRRAIQPTALRAGFMNYGSYFAVNATIYGTTGSRHSDFGRPAWKIGPRHMNHANAHAGGTATEGLSQPRAKRIVMRVSAVQIESYWLSPSLHIKTIVFGQVVDPNFGCSYRGGVRSGSFPFPPFCQLLD
jgi:hypothetical protein